MVIVFGDLSKLIEDLIPVALQKNETFISFSLVTDVWQKSHKVTNERPIMTVSYHKYLANKISLNYSQRLSSYRPVNTCYILL